MSAPEIRVTDDIETCRKLRRRVFIEEQGVPETDEIDDKDEEAVHLLATLDDEGVGTARLLIDGETGKIGRVAVVGECRGTGLGRALMEASLAELAARGAKRAKLSSQTRALGFYEALGFVPVGEEYEDAGIPHRDMVRDL